MGVCRSSPSSEGGCRPSVLTAGHVDEVLARGFVNFDVPVAYVVLMSLEGHVAVLRRDEADECLSVPTTLRAKAQCHAAPAGGKHTPGS